MMEGFPVRGTGLLPEKILLIIFIESTGGGAVVRRRLDFSEMESLILAQNER